MNLPKLLVCGGRDFTNKSLLFRTLDSICLGRKWTDYDVNGYWLPCVRLISGGARGADTLAEDWAVVNWCPTVILKADWETLGKRAGIVRNKEMLACKPDLVVAFPGGKGTAHMVRIAKEAGNEVIEVPE